MRKNIIGDIKNEILTLYKEKIVIENSIRRKNEKQMQFLNSVKNRVQLNVVKILKKTIKLNECIAILNDEENIKNLLTHPFCVEFACSPRIEEQFNQNH